MFIANQNLIPRKSKKRHHWSSYNVAIPVLQFYLFFLPGKRNCTQLWDKETLQIFILNLSIYHIYKDLFLVKQFFQIWDLSFYNIHTLLILFIAKFNVVYINKRTKVKKSTSIWTYHLQKNVYHIIIYFVIVSF